MDRTRVISIANHKGGSGKTSVSGGLIYAFAEMGYKVLGIDGCGQMNLTRSFGFKRSVDKSLYAIIKHGKNMEECIQKCKNYNDVLQGYASHDNAHENIDFIIADEEMVSVELDLVSMIERERVIKKKLKSVIDKKIYDFIIFDTNPTLGMLNLNLLAASDEMLIPVELSSFGIEGLNALLKFYQKVLIVNPKLKILGAVCNKVDNRERITQEAIEVIQSVFGDIVLKTQIRIDTKVKQAQWEGIPLYLFSKTSRASKEIQELAKEVLKIVKSRKEEIC